MGDLNVNESLNSRIKKLRKEKGLTQSQLANLLNVTDKAISKWETGEGNPDIYFLPSIASIFNVSIDYLLTGKEEEMVEEPIEEVSEKETIANESEIKEEKIVKELTSEEKELVNKKNNKHNLVMNLTKGACSILSLVCAVCLGVEVIVSSSSDYKAMVDSIIGNGGSSSSSSSNAYAFKSDFKDTNELLTDREDVAESLEEEGLVLLKNKDNSLPLRKEGNNPINVTLLGSRAFTYDKNGNLRDTHDGKRLSTYGGLTGSVIYEQNVTNNYGKKHLPVTIIDALEQENIKVNPSCIDVYSNKNFPNYVHGSEANGSQGAPFSINEPKVKATDFANTSSYNDAVIVMIGRASGEGREYLTGSKGIEDKTDGSKSALNLSDDERNLIIEANKISSNVIVLINSAVAMEIDELKEGTELASMVKSIVWIGLPGSYGMNSVARILSGKASPSGKLPDTYAVDASMSPAAQNFGVYSWSNPGSLFNKADNSHYVVCNEGIYDGYRYYETRYFDSVLNQGNADSSKGKGRQSLDKWKYEDEVSYTFGYGKEYSSFSEEIKSFSYNEETKSVNIEVEVKNTGNYKGKHVVELYVNTPYTDYDKNHEVEKSAVNLIDYNKTVTLYPEAEATKDKPNSQIISLEAKLKYIASYDKTLSHDGVVGGYILDAGDYYFALGNGAHEATNNVLLAMNVGNASKLYLEEDDNSSSSLVRKWTINDEPSLKNTFNDGISSIMSTSETGEIIKNQLEDGDYNYYKNGAIKHLSRSNWDDTFPVTYSSLEVTEQMKKYLATDETNGGRVYEFTTQTNNVVFGYDHSVDLDENGQEMKNRVVAEYKGLAYDDASWDYLLDQVTFDEAWKFSPYGGTYCKPLVSVGAPDVWQIDGPNGNVSRSIGAKANKSGMYSVTKSDPNFDYLTADMPCEPIVAATYSKELVEREGNAYGEDSIWSRNGMIWAPGMNLHRTPFNSRNHEYYSEDPMLCNLTGVSFVRGGLKKGDILSPKHFAFNTQESFREGLTQFIGEQAARELELRGFQGCYEDVDYINELGNEVNCIGMMTSFSRFGVTGVNAHTGLMKNILRKEWGFKGLSSTDMVVTGRYFNPQDGIVNNVTFMATSNGENLLANYWSDYNNKSKVRKDGYLCQEMKQNIRYYLYALANSNALNGYDASTVVKEAKILPWEIGFIVSGSSLFIISIILGGVMVVLDYKHKKEVSYDD